MERRARLIRARLVPRPSAWAVFVFLVWSCVAQPPRPTRATPVAAPTAERALAAGPATPTSPAVVLVVLDGVRWQEVFEGVDPVLARRYGLSREEVVDASALMPTLHDVLIAHGIALGATGEGPEMRATGPNYVSLPGYTEILTGRTATRCHDNDCAGVIVPTVADELAPRGGAEHGEPSAVIASWESLDRAASSGAGEVVVSAGRHGGRQLGAFQRDPTEAALLEQGTRAASAPGEGDFRPDRFTSEIALRHLAAWTPRFMFLGLGEPDEYAHRSDYRGYLLSLRAADRVLGKLVDTLRHMGERGRRTSIFVTTDHGRSSSFRDHGGFAPESGRVWLVASGGDIPENGVSRSFEPHRLADIAPTLRVLLGVPPDPSEDAGRVLSEVLREGAPWVPL